MWVSKMFSGVAEAAGLGAAPGGKPGLDNQLILPALGVDCCLSESDDGSSQYLRLCASIVQSALSVLYCLILMAIGRYYPL